MGFRIQSGCRTDAVAKRVSFEFIWTNRSTLRESIHTTKFLGLVTLTNFILFRGRKRRGWSESSQTCSSSVSFSFMNGWKHESILIIENNNFIFKCIQTCTLWNASNLITSLLPWYGLQSRWGGAGRTKKSAFVSSIEIGSDTGLFPAFCRAAMASETMAQQESGLMRAGSGFVPCRSQENNHTKNANKLDGEIDIPICAMCVWFHNHPYSEFAGQSHVYLFLMFPMTMPS